MLSLVGNAVQRPRPGAVLAFERRAEQKMIALHVRNPEGINLLQALAPFACTFSWKPNDPMDKDKPAGFTLVVSGRGSWKPNKPLCEPVGFAGQPYGNKRMTRCKSHVTRSEIPLSEGRDLPPFVACSLRSVYASA